MTDKWNVGDIVSPEYYRKCVKLYEFRYWSRYPQEFMKEIPPLKPLPTPCVVRVIGLFGSRKQDGWYSMGVSQVDAFNNYGIPKQEEEKHNIFGFIKRLFIR